MARNGSGKDDRKIDRIDRAIIAEMQDDPHVSNKEIAKRLEVSELTVASRIDGLISDKLIKMTVQKDIRTAGYRVVGIVDVFASGPVLPLAHRLGEIPAALSVSVFVDEPQILVLVAAASLEDLFSTVTHEIGSEPGVRRTSVAVSLDPVMLKPGIAAL